MRLTIHRSECCVWRGEELIAKWERFRFKPSPGAYQRTMGTWAKSRDASVPIEVLAPVGSKFVMWTGPATGREIELLRTWFTPIGLDAGMIWSLASNGERGFSLAPKAGVKEEFYSPAATHLAEWWTIAFAPKSGDCPSFLHLSALSGPLRSTTNPLEVAQWQSRSEAESWLRRSRLDPEKPVPIGVGYLYPSVVEKPTDISPFGVAFELPRVEVVKPTPMPEPERVVRKQGAFAFA